MYNHFWKSKILFAVIIGLFALMVFAEAMPSPAGSDSRLPAQDKEHNENGKFDQSSGKNRSTQAVAAENEEMAAPVAQLKNEEAHSQPTVKEHETAAPQVKKKKKFPWLPVILVLAAGAAAAYFLLIKEGAEESEEPFRDDFTGSASPLWRPRSPGLWQVVAEAYHCFISNPSFSEYNYVDRTFAANDLAIEVRLRQVQGDIKHAQGVFYVTDSVMNAVTGFEFRIHTYMRDPGAFSIIRYDNADLANISPGGTTVAALTTNAAILGAPGWNTVRIVRAGNNYSFYCNGVLLHSFSDDTIDPAVTGLRLFNSADPHILDCDFFSVDF